MFLLYLLFIAGFLFLIAFVVVVFVLFLATFKCVKFDLRKIIELAYLVAVYYFQLSDTCNKGFICLVVIILSPNQEL